MGPVGVEVLGAIEGGQDAVPEAAHARQGTLAIEVAGHGAEDIVEMLPRHDIERLADLVVARYLIHSEQGVGVGIAVRCRRNL